jgi:hypothetical protein
MNKGEKKNDEVRPEYMVLGIVIAAIVIAIGRFLL